MKSDIYEYAADQWVLVIVVDGMRGEIYQYYGRRRDAVRGLYRYLSRVRAK